MVFKKLLHVAVWQDVVHMYTVICTLVDNEVFRFLFKPNPFVHRLLVGFTMSISSVNICKSTRFFANVAIMISSYVLLFGQGYTLDKLVKVLPEVLFFYVDDTLRLRFLSRIRLTPFRLFVVPCYISW